MRVPQLRAVVAPVAVLLLTACGTSSQRAADAPVWSLSVEPQVIIGQDGSAEGRLTNVVAAVPMRGGEIAVADRSETPVRAFGEDGRFRRVIGRSGSAEGELGLVAWAARLGDTLLVYDIGRRHAVWFRNDGTVLSALEPRAEGHEGTVTPTGRLAGGSWLVSAGAPAPRVAGPEGVFRDTLYFGTLPAGGTGPLAIAHRSLTPAVVQVPGTTRFVPGHYFALPVAVPLGDRFAVADAEEGTLAVYTEQGVRESSVSLPMPRQRTSRAELDRQREAALAGLDERARPAVEARFTPAAMPTHVPAFRRAVADAPDALWLEEWSADPAAPARYHVVGTDGSWRARVDMPPGFSPLTVGPDWVLGVHRNPEGLQRVVRYGLTRAAPPPEGTSLAILSPGPR